MLAPIIALGPTTPNRTEGLMRAVHVELEQDVLYHLKLQYNKKLILDCRITGLIIPISINLTSLDTALPRQRTSPVL